MTALQMCTINAATHFGMERELGAIAPGRRADLALTDSLTRLDLDTVICRGEVIAEGGEMQAPRPGFVWPAAAKDTVRLARRMTAEDFRIPAPPGARYARARVIGVVENQAPTRALEAELPVRDGFLAPEDCPGDVCRIAVVERHHGTGRVANALVCGFGYDVPCAIASTVAHDSHQILVVGTSAEDMARAVNRLADLRGGVSVFREGAEIACVPLPVAGLMSDAPAEEVAAQAERMAQALRDCGCRMNNAFMQHSLLALVVIPSLRISDLGLVDVDAFAPTEVVLG